MLEHASSARKSKKIIRMPLISGNQTSEVLQPSEKPFDFPASLMPPQLSAILSFWLCAVAAVWRDHLNTVLFQKIIIELVTVTGFAANEFLVVGQKG